MVPLYRCQTPRFSLLLHLRATTEVIDNFTYGATLGVEAQSVSGFALGLGVGYTGSSETDEFSAQAKVRYTF